MAQPLEPATPFLHMGETMRTADREYDCALLAGEALEDELPEAPVRVAHESRLDAAGAAWCQARDQLVITTPTTLAGLLAVAMFIRDYPAEALLVDELLQNFVTTLAKAIEQFVPAA
jgi:hypothetical protein